MAYRVQHRSAGLAYEGVCIGAAVAGLPALAFLAVMPASATHKSWAKRTVTRLVELTGITATLMLLGVSLILPAPAQDLQVVAAECSATAG